MNIFFYLNNEDHTSIVSFYDMVSNPFNVGDTINLNVSELYPKDFKGYNEELVTKMKEDNKELTNLFRLKAVKIVRESKFVDIRLIKDSKVTIEYYCEFVND